MMDQELYGLCLLLNRFWGSELHDFEGLTIQVHILKPLITLQITLQVFIMNPICNISMRTEVFLKLYLFGNTSIPHQ